MFYASVHAIIFNINHQFWHREDFSIDFIHVHCDFAGNRSFLRPRNKQFCIVLIKQR